ncbi:MAG: undecaprenyl-diphosphate phosphatase [Myxococcaceae bacterium]
MGLLRAVVLGLVQGITEFLPISSTAHLRITPELFGWQDPGAAFDAIIQLGTVAAVLVYFRRDIVQLLRAWVDGLQRRDLLGTTESRLAWFVLLGTLPVVVLGFLFKHAIETSLRSLYVVAGSMIVLALVLAAAERTARHSRRLDDMTWKDGWIIGLWQALALVPGSSRSGTTLTGGLWRGLRREDAARYSFLLSIPATTAAGLFELRHLRHASTPFTGAELGVAAAVAFVSGMLAIGGLLRYLRTRTTMVFVVYRLLLGARLLALLTSGRVRPDAGLEHGTPPTGIPAEAARREPVPR